MNNNLFGTDGIRNRVGQEPFTQKQLQQLGSAIASWAQTRYNSAHPVGVIASDTRISCSFVKASLLSGMLLSTVKLIDVDILPTPAVFALLKQHDTTFNFGIVISASHNPYADNGIKLIDGRTGKLTEMDEIALSSLYYQTTPTHTYTQFSTVTQWPHASQEYSAAITHYFKPNMLKNRTIVLDCAHGATSTVAPSLFNLLGGRTIVINNTPNGTNINDKCGALYPESLQLAVKKHKADMGFAFDGDGDRVIAVNNKGEIKNGDDILALLATHHRYVEQKTIVGTIMSNEGLADHLRLQNKHLVRTAVGDKHISAYLQRDHLLLGGEQSGHIIMNDYLPAGDGIFTALSMLEAMIETNNKECATFIHYPQILINIPVLTKQDLSHKPYADIIADYAEQLTNGRLEVRYSGTENLLRVMVESKDKELALSIGNQLAYNLKKKLSTL
ncbi:MAG: phosphoglucosamine mutase [Candidatus Dependentiae bacterium]|nr:phosphoglucosamine mutase [Candidatus Dependentiae bacterium]